MTAAFEIAESPSSMTAVSEKVALNEGSSKHRADVGRLLLLMLGNGDAREGHVRRIQRDVAGRPPNGYADGLLAREAGGGEVGSDGQVMVVWRDGDWQPLRKRGKRGPKSLSDTRQ